MRYLQERSGSLLSTHAEREDSCGDTRRDSSRRLASGRLESPYGRQESPLIHVSQKNSRVGRASACLVFVSNVPGRSVVWTARQQGVLPIPALIEPASGNPTG